MSQAAFGPFATVILDSRGVSAAAIGGLGALISIAFLGAASGWGHLADAVLGRARTLSLVALLTGAFLAVFALPVPIVVAAAAYAGWGATFGMATPLSDALAINALPDAARQYGRLRGTLSGAFAVTAVGLGFVYDRVGYAPAAPLFVVLAVALALLARRLPDIGAVHLTGGQRGGAVRAAFKAAPRLPRVLVAVSIAYIGIFIGMTFLPLAIVRLGGGSTEVAFSWAATAALEVVAMPLASRLVARYGTRLVFVLSCLLLTVVYLAWAAAPSATFIVAIRVVYAFGWSGLLVACVATIAGLLPGVLQASGQSLLSITTGGVSGLVANVAGGLLFGAVGPWAVFAVSALTSAVAAVAGWLALPKREVSSGS